MRVSFTAGIAAATCLALSVGCSTLKVPSMPSFAKKSKVGDDTSVTNAPPAPQFNTPAAPLAGVSAPNTTASWNNLPVYPGTSYPQTPYPAPMLTASPAGYAAPTGVAQTVPMPPAVAPGESVNPYTAYPPQVAQAPPAYAPSAAASPYAPPPAPPQASPYAQPPAAPPQAPAYAQQTPPYTPPANPYAMPPQNAANPYAPVAR